MGSQDTLFPLPSTRKQSRNIYDVEERRRLLGDDFTEKLEPETLSKAWSNSANVSVPVLNLMLLRERDETSSQFTSISAVAAQIICSDLK